MHVCLLLDRCKEAGDGILATRSMSRLHPTITGKWETNNHSDRPGHWKEGDNWDGWSTNRSLEFENIMTWDDSGAVEAYHVANERHKAFSRGLRYPTPLPSPDLYIQTIDWDTHESFELPDSGETTLETEERSGQRKRGRRGFKGDKRGNKQFSKKDDEYSDWKQTDRLASESGQPQAVSGWGRDIYRGSSKAEISRKEMYHTTPIAERQERHDGERYYGASDPAFMERPTYWGHTDRLKTPQESQLQHPISYDYSPQNHYNFRWQQQNISGDVPRGWSSPLVKGVRESHQGVNPHYCYQVGQTSTGLNPGDEWAGQYGSNNRVFKPYGQSSRGQRHLRPAPGPW